MNQPTEFTLQVIGVVKKIPRGKVSTYGHIAELAGKPNAIRAVVWILHSCSKAYKLPWQRVVNSKGRIAFDRKASNYRRQKLLLKKEGVGFGEDDQIDLGAYKWKKKPKRSRRVMPRMFG